MRYDAASPISGVCLFNSDDLRAERQQATQAILEAGFFPSGMELFPASNDAQWELIKRVIEESDYYVVIVAGRYGSLCPEGMSYTEMEYDYAVRKASLFSASFDVM